MIHETVTDALAEARMLVAADGGDFELTGIDDASSTISVRLILEGVSCHECVMPRPILEEMLTNMLRGSVADVAQVVIDDPRERPD
jgi:Fe-S cluster biogenesis protein NfuA